MRLSRSPWDVPHHPLRTLLLFRGIHALLAFDAWTLMIEHGGRYGVGAFNVAHFDLIDRWLPLPSPRLYIALVTFAGLYALLGAFGLLSRFDALVLWAVYSLSWMLSMHDSYQHHYLLSWLLAFSVCVPTLSVRQCVRNAALVSDCGLPSAAFCCAIVYLFTAVSKLSEPWLRGAVLYKLAHDGGPMAWAPTILVALGLSEASAWALAARAIVVLQLLLALGFLASIYRDAHDSRRFAFASSAAFIGALSFHAATELTPAFAIGWFSYYMLWIATVLLSPAAWLVQLLRPLARLRARFGPPSGVPRHVLLLSLLCLSFLGLFVLYEDLPGVPEAVAAFSAAWLVRALIASCALYCFARARTHALRHQTALGHTLTCAAALGVLSLTLSLASVRFDYFRRAAGELARMGRSAEALVLYRKAELHAPRGQSRRARIEELEQSISGQRGQ